MLHKLARIRTNPPEYRGERWQTPECFATIVAQESDLKGNRAPYFSVTVNGRDFGGCNHDLVLQVRPDLEPLVRLHLAWTDNGEPLHADDNARHWVSGALPELAPFYPYRPNSRPGEPVQDCLTILADHLRLPARDVTEFLGNLSPVLQPLIESWKAGRRVVQASDITAAVRAQVAVFVDLQRPRWQKEAEEGRALLASLPDDDR